MKRKCRLSIVPLLSLAVAVTIWPGCASERNTTAPDGAAEYTAANPPPTLQAAVQTPAAQGLLDWLVVAKAFVLPGFSTRVAGGREELRFSPGSLLLTALVTIQEKDPNQVLFQLNPHGLLFGTPVTLNISYRGTNADPSSPNYDGSTPTLYWLNPWGVWETVPGTDDPVNRVYSAKLPHFSTYTLAKANQGNAEW